MIDAKKYLEEIAKDDAVIKNKLAEIGRLESLATSISSVVSDTPVQSSGNHDRVGKIASDIADKKAELQLLVDEFIDKRNARIKIIEQLEDNLQYTVIYKRYMQQKKFEDIAEEEHYSYRWVLTIHSKGIKNSKIF